MMSVSRPRTAVSMMNCRSPIAPSSSSARTSRLIGSRRKFSATERILPLRSAAAMIWLQPRIVSASGFSQRVCSPRSSSSRGDPMVRAGIGRAGGRLQPVGLPHHRRQIGEDGRPAAEQLPAPRRPGRWRSARCRSQTATSSTSIVVRSAPARPTPPGAAAPSRRSRRSPVGPDLRSIRRSLCTQLVSLRTATQPDPHRSRLPVRPRVIRDRREGHRFRVNHAHIWLGCTVERGGPRVVGRVHPGLGGERHHTTEEIRPKIRPERRLVREARRRRAPCRGCRSARRNRAAARASRRPGRHSPRRRGGSRRTAPASAGCRWTMSPGRQFRRTSA